MKKNINKILTVLFVGLFAASFNGCILDAFNNLPVNAPLSIKFFAAGTDTVLAAAETLYLDSSQTIKDYSSNIQNISFIGITFGTDSASTGLKGDLLLTITKNDSDKIPLISIVENGISPSDYINKPLKFTLTPEVINNINNYLNSAPLKGKTFVGNLRIHITNGDHPYFIAGHVDIALQLDTNL